MNAIVSMIVAIVVVLLYVQFLMPLLPAPFGILILILVIVSMIGYGWRMGGWPMP